MAETYQWHHGGGLWLKDEGGWFMVRNLAGIEWEYKFCADPARVDQVRQNARRLYARFPEAVEELGIRQLLDTPITDAAGVDAWVDSVCNASVPLPPPLHTGILPEGAGVHNYPAPAVEVVTFQYQDFQVWVLDDEAQPAGVVPIAPRHSGDARVRVIYATPNTQLYRRFLQAQLAGEPLVLLPNDPLARQAWRKQINPSIPPVPTGASPFPKTPPASRRPAAAGRSATKRRTRSRSL